MLKFIHPGVKTVALSVLLLFPIQFIAALPAISSHHEVSEKKTIATPAYNGGSFDVLYNDLQLADLELSQDAFNLAVRGFRKMMSLGTLQNTDILSIVDFSLPSNKKRLFVIDVTNGKLLFNTYVAHGRNSGKDIANSFSNRANSFKSSLGFYVTGDTYMGDNGYSLRLQGKEKGINDNAYKRKIVMHGASYVSEASIEENGGFLGRSLGCPAVPEELSKDIIDTIQNGSCLFIYKPNKQYIAKSSLLHSSTAKKKKARV